MTDSERKRLGLELQARLLDLRTRIAAIPGGRRLDTGDELFSVVCVASFERLEQYVPWTDGRVMQIAWNRWHAFQREACRRPCPSVLQEATEILSNGTPDKSLSDEERCVQLRGVHRRLRKCSRFPKEYRRILWKRFAQNQSIREIAADLGCHLETVRTRYKRAKAELLREPVLRELAGF